MSAVSPARYVEISLPSTCDDPARELSGYADGLEVRSPPDVRARMTELGALLVRHHGAALTGS